MIDIMNVVYECLQKDEYITEYVDFSKDVHFNEFPELSTFDRPTILISEIDEPRSDCWGDNEDIALSYLVQIDVYVKGSPNYNARLLRNKLSQKISDFLKIELGMSNSSNNPPEYDNDSKIYRSARRYEGTFYRNERISI